MSESGKPDICTRCTFRDLECAESKTIDRDAEQCWLFSTHVPTKPKRSEVSWSTSHGQHRFMVHYPNGSTVTKKNRKDENSMSHIGKLFLTKRKKAGLKSKEVVVFAGYTKISKGMRHLQELEDGRSSIPKLWLVEKFVAALGITQAEGQYHS
jgi:hypothetical protein